MNKEKDLAILSPNLEDGQSSLAAKKLEAKIDVSANKLHVIHHYWLNKQNAYPTYFQSQNQKNLQSTPVKSEFHFSKENAERLIQTAKGRDFNIYKIALAGLCIVLHKYTGRESLLLYTSAIRLDGFPKTSEVILSPNIVLDGKGKARPLLKKIHQELEKNISHQEYDYPEFIQQYPSGIHYSPATMDIAFHYAPLNDRTTSIEQAKILLELKREKDTFQVQITAPQDWQGKAGMEQFNQHFRECVDQICRNLDIHIPEIVLSDSTVPICFAKAKVTADQTVLRDKAVRSKLEYYPLSPPQNRMFILQYFDENTIAYNIPFHAPLPNSFAVETIHSVFDQLIARHESLRTSFELRGDTPVQIIHEKVDFEVAVLEGMTPQNALQEFIRPFDLTQAPLIRVAYLKGEEQAMILIDIHHIVTDAFSQDVLGEEIALLLAKQTLPPVPLQYKDYIKWLAREPQLERLKTQKDYWLSVFSESVPLLDFPLDFPRPNHQTFVGVTASFLATKAEMKILNRLANAHTATMNTLLLGIWTILLSKITGEEDIVVGTPVAGRTHPDLKQIIGMFVNTVPLRNYPRNDRTFADFIQEVKSHFIAGFDHQDYPFEALVEQVWDGKIKGRNPIFDTMFGLLNSVDTDENLTEDHEDIDFDPTRQVAKFDIDFAASYRGDRLHFSLNYNVDLYQKETIIKFVHYFRKLIRDLENGDQLLLKDLSILSEEERDLLLSFNPERVTYPTDQTVVQQFEQQALQNPEATAIVFKQQSLSYQQLNEQANQLAHYLKTNYTIQADDRIAIQLDRSENLIIALLGVLKTGAAYVPIDPQYPTKRIEYLLEDSGSKALIDPKEWEKFSEEQTKYSTDNWPLQAKADDLAYVIYTSGSTGKAKGVMISHRNLSARLFSEVDLLKLDQNLVTCFLTNYVFDASVLELFLPLILGGQLLVLSRTAMYQSEEVIKDLCEAKVSLLQGTPSSLVPLVEMIDETNRIGLAIHTICLGGESLNPNIVQLIREKLPTVKINNHYGPTEVTIDAVVAEEITTFERNIIGRPMVNMQAFILDAHQQLLPVGVKGELCIAGDGLARGYLNLEEQTRQQFIDFPLARDQRLYKTGDLARWLSDGTIEFFGRLDDQVKIRGFRIELGEVETVLQQAPDVAHAVVMVKGNLDEQPYLVAYVLPRGTFDKTAIQSWLKTQLPDYMVPSIIMEVDAFPLTPNGKIDKKQLPEPNFSSLLIHSYVAPENEVEEQLVEIWQKLLKVKQVGVLDNFFDLGGHSLIAVQIANQIQRVFEVKMPLSHFFGEATIRHLADYILESEKEAYHQIPLAPAMEHYPLSHSQNGLWLIQQLNPNLVAYNVPDIQRIKGQLDPIIVEQCFRDTIERHEILRTVFREVDREPRQFIYSLEEMPPFFQYLDFREEPNAEDKSTALTNDFVATIFDFSNGPLIKVMLIQLGEADFILGVNLHHIICDGWSSTLLFSEILNRYYALSENQLFNPASLKIQYKDFAYWQRESITGEANQIHQQFWLKKLSGELPRLNLPEDFPRPSFKTFNGKGYGTLIENDIIVPIEQMALDHNASLFMVVLAALNTLFYRYTGLNDIIIGGPVAGREREELADQLGYYVNTIVLRTQFPKTATFAELIEIVKTDTLAVYEHQYYPFDLLVQQLELPNDPARSPLFDISFTFNNVESVEEAQSDQIEDVEGKTVGWETKASKFDISFGVERGKGGLQLGANYNADIYEEATIARMLTHFRNLLQSIGAHKNKPIAELDYLGEERMLLKGFNQTAKEKAFLPSIPTYFEQQVLAQPKQTAVIVGSVELTYQEVNEKANQLAHWLLSEYQIQKDEIVAFMINRDEWQIITMLGILKAGAAFLPIDPSYPSNRVSDILTDAQPRLVLIHSKTAWEPTTDVSDFDIVNVDALQFGLANFATENPNQNIEPTDLAYVIYTSGSTGKPKGVMIEHRGNQNMVTDQVNRFGVNVQDRCLQFASISFDASVYEIFIALYAGCPIVLLPEGVIDNPIRFVDYLEEKQVTFVTLPPVYLAKLERKRLHFLRVIVTAGEAPNLSDVRYYSQYLDYYNAFGPTEFSVCTSVYKVKGDETIIPIGKPLENTQYYILDENLQAMPIGFWGEIYIAGTGMARGYINRPTQTAATFVDHIFEPGTKMYKSGDLGRWLPSGDVEFAGRNDDMVKIRGYRVELAEIEQVLMRHPLVKHALVTYRKTTDYRDFLTAYFLSEKAVEKTVLQTFLQEFLPQYMIPTYYIQLDEIPLTSNGKTDYKALPVPDIGGEERALQAANNALEAELLEIWKKLLETDQIGVDEAFFEIGGHSLLAMMLIAEVWDQYKFNLTIGDLVNHPTIESLALLLAKAEESRGLVLPLNKNYEGQPNVFMLPPILGTPIIFYALAALFEEHNLNCYGLQYKGFDQGMEPDASIEAMATSFYQEIVDQSFDASKPLTILGYSMGGLIAFELVHLLEQNGYRCHLVLLDKEAFSADKRVFKKQIGGDEEVIAAQLWEAHRQSSGLEFSEEEAQRMKRFLWHNWTVHNQYILNKKIQSSILAIEAAEMPDKNAMKAWKKQTKGNFVYHRLPTDHHGILEDIHLPKILRWVLDLLANQ